MQVLDASMQGRPMIYELCLNSACLGEQLQHQCDCRPQNGPGSNVPDMAHLTGRMNHAPTELEIDVFSIGFYSGSRSYDAHPFPCLSQKLFTPTVPIDLSFICTCSGLCVFAISLWLIKYFHTFCFAMPVLTHILLGVRDFMES